MALTLDQASKFANLQNRLRAAAKQDPDPFTSNVQTANSTAGLISDAANLAQAAGYSGDAVKLKQVSGGVFAEKLAGNAWFSLAAHAAGIISAILIKSGFRDLDAGWMDLRVGGPSLWEIQRKYYGATHQPTMERVEKLPAPPPPPPPPPPEPSVSDVAKSQTSTQSLTDNNPNPQVRLQTMAIDEITGVEDPLSGPQFQYRNAADISASSGDGFDWGGALGGALGAGLSGGGVGDILQGGIQGGGIQTPGGLYGNGNAGGIAPGNQPVIPSSALPDWLKNALGLNGGKSVNENVNGNGGMVPGVFDVGDIFQMLPNFQGGNGQVGSSLMLPGIVQPTAQTRLKAPKGYVIVEVAPDHPLYPVAVNAGGVQQPDGAVKIAMRKQQAKDMKLWKKRPKPALTSGDMKTLRRAETLKKKVARAYLKAGVSPRTLKEVKSC